MNFVLFGAAGYIAPRHLDAIKELGYNLVAAFDPSDSVGLLDRYFPNCAFFTNMEKLDQFVKGQKIDYVSICSPNHKHFEHIQWGLSKGANVICEKPMVLTIEELDKVKGLEKTFGKKVYTILQLRVHPAIRELKAKVDNEGGKTYDVKLAYLTSRGPWYLQSWKGDVAKSGGLSTNIGIHLFDMLAWIFGSAKDFHLSEKTPTKEAGVLDLERARVQWDLCIERKRLPASVASAGKTTYRSIMIDGKEFEFSEGFTELHKTIYRDIIAGNGYGIEDARPAIAMAEKIRTAKVTIGYSAGSSAQHMSPLIP